MMLCVVCNIVLCVQNKEEEAAAAEEVGGGVSRAGYLFLMEKSEFLMHHQRCYLPSFEYFI